MTTPFDENQPYIDRPRSSCALSGAMTTITAIPRGIPVLHSSPGCAGNTAWTQLGGGALQVGGYCGALNVPGTNIQEREVVFGGDTRLREEIAHTVEVIDGDLYVVISGCIPAMIGDDIVAAVADQVDAGKPVVVANTAGFKGNAYLGYDLVLEAIIEQFVKRGLPQKKGKVNLLGIVPSWDVFWRGNIAAVRELLEAVGLEVNSFFSADDCVADISRASEAEYTIVVSGAYGIRAATALKKHHGVPWLSFPLPIGPTQSGEFLRQVAVALHLDSKTVEKVITDRERRYYSILESLTDCYSDMDLQRYAVVIGDANYSASIPRFLAEDLGWLPELTVCTEKQLDGEGQQRIQAAIDAIDASIRPELVFDSDTSRVPEHLNRRWPQNTEGTYRNAMSPAFVVGSSFDREFALSIGAAHLSVSFPVANRAVLDRGYAGYSGGLRLIEDLLSSIILGR